LYKTVGGSREKAVRGETSLEDAWKKEGKEEEALKILRARLMNESSDIE
jgi:hypothetical protein